MVVPAIANEESDWKSKWKVIGNEVEVEDIVTESSADAQVKPSIGSDSLKRKMNDETTCTTQKKPRLDESLAGPTRGSTDCTAPPLNKRAQLVLQALEDGGFSVGAKGDLFLVDGVKEAMCRCTEVCDLRVCIHDRR